MVVSDLQRFSSFDDAGQFARIVLKESAGKDVKEG
jgi:hypothetical protein